MTTPFVSGRFVSRLLLVAVLVLCRDADAHPWHRHAEPGGAERSAAHEETSGQANVARAEPDATEAGHAVPVNVFRLTADRPARGAATSPSIIDAFTPFVERGEIAIRQDDRWLYVESHGVPDHPLMVGIRTWQQQVPLPQPYVGENAWQIPIKPVPAANPQSTRNAFLRGAIAVAVNGIPIFNPLNNRGEDSFAIGELDTFGGHCGRADDYHYHQPPVHLEQQVGKGMPIAYALDGYPIYGFTEPDGSRPRSLDVFNGHETPELGYHYHATTTYPYLNGGFHGEVIEKDGQVDPQPRAQPRRESLRQLPGARIVSFTSPAADTKRLVYEVGGREGSVEYTLRDNGSVLFTYIDPNGVKTSEEVHERRGGGGGRQGSNGQRGGEQRGGGERGRGQKKNGPVQQQQLQQQRGGRQRMERGPSVPEPPTRPGRSAAPPSRSARLEVSSSAIGGDGQLPAEFTCDGAGVSPPLAWSGAPAGTASYALSLWHDSPDGVKSYWVVHGIPASVTALPKAATGIGVEGLNGRRRTGYDPMCSRGPGSKTYHVSIYALSKTARLPADGVTRDDLLQAIDGAVLAEGQLTFTYTR